jgi:pimeloyl-ACP methyl ester carboxylesterase
MSMLLPIPEQCIVTLHGMGRSQPDYLKYWEVESLSKLLGPVVPFYYDDLMGKALSDKLVRVAVKLGVRMYAGKVGESVVDLPADYLEDLFGFFLNEKVRREIFDRLDQTLQFKPRVTLVGYSLGAIIGFVYLCSRPEVARKCKLVTLGSAQGSMLLGGVVRYFIRRILKQAYGVPLVRSWVNIWSGADPLSGTIPRELHEGFGVKDYGVPAGVGLFHTNVAGYVKAFVGMVSNL